VDVERDIGCGEVEAVLNYLSSIGESVTVVGDGETAA
jgi:hypothetical protein